MKEIRNEQPVYSLEEKLEMEPFTVICPCEIYRKTKVCPATGERNRFEGLNISFERPACKYFYGKKLRNTELTVEAVNTEVFCL